MLVRIVSLSWETILRDPMLRHIQQDSGFSGGVFTTNKGFGARCLQHQTNGLSMWTLTKKPGLGYVFKQCSWSGGVAVQRCNKSLLELHWIGFKVALRNNLNWEVWFLSFCSVSLSRFPHSAYIYHTLALWESCTTYLDHVTPFPQLPLDSRRFVSLWFVCF